MANWTPEQLSAIEARDCNLLVAAAAGSGKTAVLVERIIQLMIRDKADIDHMLIVTFTNAAAGEMRERIGAALLEAIEEDNDSGEHLRRQLNLLSKASISTLHAFCIGVLRKYFHMIDLDPGFRIGDETENNILRLEAMEELLEEEYERGDEDFLGLVERFGGTREDTPLQDLILRLHRFVQSKPYPKEWLLERIEDFCIPLSEAGRLPWMRAIEKQIRMDLSGALSLTHEALMLCSLPGGPDTYEEALRSDEEQLEALLTALNLGPEACCQQFFRLDIAKLKRCGKDVDEALKNRVKDLRDQAKKVLKDLENGFFLRTFEDFFEDLYELHPYMHCLGRLVFDFDRAYETQKQEKGILDFNDLEHLALRILSDEKAAKELREHYEYIFVDEYQDSNIVQETIIGFIRRENNLFMVGDVKQSIYRFRLADPSLFLEKYRTFDVRDGAVNRRIDLNRNFRSRFHVLEGVNTVFRAIMSEEFGEIAYDEDAALYPGLLSEPIADPQVELHIVEKAVAEDAALDTDVEDLSDIQVEAYIAAQSITEMLKKDIYDAKLGTYRLITYRDIVVLMRSTVRYAPVFQEVLASQGIPVYADVNTGYFEALEIKTFVHLLKIIDNKCQDLSLLCIMRSPIGNFSTDDLIAIRVNSHAKHFYQAVSEYRGDQEDALKQRLDLFYERISTWQQSARYLPMEDLLWYLFTETGYYEYTGAMPGGKQRQANLRILLDRATQFQKTSIRGLFHFIRSIDKLQSSSGDMGTAKTIGENENVLRIMSIHKSKGLEFPVVLVAGIGKQFNLSDIGDACLVHKDLGLGPKYVNPDTRQTCDTLARLSMKGVIRLESLSEEMRILYVAMTRPKDKLILLGSMRDLARRVEKWTRTQSPYQLAKGKCFLDWIGPALLRHPDGGALRSMLEEEALAGLTDGPSPSIDPSESASTWRVRLYNRGSLQGIGVNTIGGKDLRTFFAEGSPIADEDLYQQIQERFAWRYPHVTAGHIPSKMTVTEVKRLLDKDTRDKAVKNIAYRAALGYATTLLDRPGFMEGTKRFTAAEKGTLVHFVLQHLNLSAVNTLSQIEEQLSFMIQKELITEEEAAVVETDRLWHFFLSPVGKRILTADTILRELPFNYRKAVMDIIPGLKDCDEYLLLQGVIDCCFEEEGGWVLVDYKTDHIFPGSVTPEEIAARYKVQLELYGEALSRITGRPVKEKILYLLSTGQAFVF